MSIGNNLYFPLHYFRCTFLPQYAYPKQGEFSGTTDEHFEKQFPEVSTGIYAKEDSNKNDYLINRITFSEQGDDFASVSFQLQVSTLLAKPVPSAILSYRGLQRHIL